MAAFSGPEIVNDGLVFAYDMDNPLNSWKGKPTTNLSVGKFFSGNGNFTTNETIQDVLPNGKIGDVRYLNADFVNDANRTVSIGSYSLTAGETYTLSFYVKNINCTGFSGNLYSPGLGRVISGISYPQIFTDRWTRVVKTFTVPDEGVDPVVVSPQAFRDGGYGFFKMSFLQMEQGPVATPFTPGTRSNTEAILDWTGNSTITASSLTYNTDGTFEFDGTSHNLYVDNFPQIWAGSVSLEGWFYFNDDNVRDVLFGCYSSTPGINFERHTSNRLRIWWNTGSNDIYTPNNVTPANQWSHIVMIRNKENGSFDFYVNGVLVHQPSVSSADIIVAPSLFRIGRDTRTDSTMLNGIISNIKVYNRALSEDEVKRNFAASRSRYYPPIVSSGLILHLDAASSASYPGTGNTWYDISGQGADAVAVNMPTFVSDGSQSYFQFDGADHEFHSVDKSQEYRDLFVLLRPEADASGLDMVFGKFDNQDDSFRLNSGVIRITDADVNDWQYLEEDKVYVNDQTNFSSSPNIRGQWSLVRMYRSNTSGFGTSFRYEISSSFFSDGRHFDGRIAAILCYNRELTDQEVLQNFKSLRGRFGL